MCVQTTKAANEQECPQISETAWQLSQQGAGSTPWLLSATRGAPQSDKGMPGFSRHGMCRGDENCTAEKREEKRVMLKEEKK